MSIGEAMANKTCNDCRFYDSEFVDQETQKKFGFCFRYPPTALAENKSSPPIVRRELRECGDFKPKPAKAKARARK
jgi:hypothetical protein